MEKIIGIDLGTTSSCVAVMENGSPRVIANSEGARFIPSVVSFTSKGEALVGEPARRQAVTNINSTVVSVKRHMGEDYRFEYGGISYSPQKISAMILQKLKKAAEDYLGERVTEAVIAVPACFTNAQRQATIDAGRIAGLNVRRIINEPGAAAIAYSLDGKKEEIIMVFDIGGGTFDVSIIDIGDGVCEVLATSGNDHLGGDDFDLRIADYLIEQFKAKEGIDLRGDKMAVQRLREAAENAKRVLSSATTAKIKLPYVAMDRTEPKHMDMDLTRDDFNRLTADLVKAVIVAAQDTLRETDLSVDEIDKVLLVGGASRIPAVQEEVAKFTGKEPFKGIKSDECVALGASIQGGKSAGDAGAGGIMLLDVTPLSLGIETAGGVSTVLIPRNTTIPVNKKQIFSTNEDNQTAVDINVVQGEKPLAKDNESLGQFRLDGIAPAPKGIPQIEVTFDIDANGIVDVKAKNLDTGKTQDVKITSSAKLSEEEIKRAVRELEELESRCKPTENDEKASVYTKGVRDTVEKFLPVLDNLEMAISSFKDKENPLYTGVEMTLNQTLSTLKALGVEEIPAEGRFFDPMLHNAIAHIEDKRYGTGVVVEVYRKGYKMGDKVIRYSLVKVAN